MLKREDRHEEIAELEAAWAIEQLKPAGVANPTGSAQLSTASTPSQQKLPTNAVPAVPSPMTQQPPQRSVSFSVPPVAGVKRPAPDFRNASGKLPCQGSLERSMSEGNISTPASTVPKFSHPTQSAASNPAPQPPQLARSQTQTTTSPHPQEQINSPQRLAQSPLSTFKPTSTAPLEPTSIQSPAKQATPPAIDRSRDPRLAHRRPPPTPAAADTTAQPNAANAAPAQATSPNANVGSNTTSNYPR